MQALVKFNIDFDADQLREYFAEQGIQYADNKLANMDMLSSWLMATISSNLQYDTIDAWIEEISVDIKEE